MTIQEILRQHQISDDLNCECGYNYDQHNPNEETFEVIYTTHQAEVLEKHMQEREAEAVRETARNIERLYPRKGLINRADLLADIEIAADRLGRGIHANGRDKRPANGR